MDLVKLSKHKYYYHSRTAAKGRSRSDSTVKVFDNEREICTNQSVVEEIVKVQSDPDTNYGYRKMTIHLMILGFIVNHKKVYRLMKESQLLKPQRRMCGKSYAKYRTVMPKAPLEVLEMDIKQVWITEHRRHAYVLNIIDTFTRVVLYWGVGYQMKQAQVKAAWEQVIIEHLQPADQLSKGVHIEIRNDNGPQFSATEIQRFFKENYLHQIFTHPYTPQENGHVESFHSILKKALESHVFWSLTELENRLEVFYDNYNNKRLHASIAYLWPIKFWELWNEEKIIRIELSKWKVKFKLTIPYQTISGNGNQREVSCSKLNPLVGGEILQKEANGPKASNYTTSVKRSPSVVSC